MITTMYTYYGLTRTLAPNAGHWKTLEGSRELPFSYILYINSLCPYLMGFGVGGGGWGKERSITDRPDPALPDRAPRGGGERRGYIY